MAYSRKTWQNRISEYPNRRTLTDEEQVATTYTVTRNEGRVSQAGDAFSAENMNDFEGRVEAAFTEITTTVSNTLDEFATDMRTVKADITLTASGWTNNIYTVTNANVHVNGTSETVQDLSPRRGITLDQLKAFNKAMIVDYSQAEGRFQIIALNGAPTVDIPVTVIFRGYN